jgi:hypothetical protein
MDGLSLHDRKGIAANIRIWLNAEWNKKKTINENIFTVPIMDSFSFLGKPSLFSTHVHYYLVSSLSNNKNCIFFPVPKQKNNFDCGVFLCQFAVSILQHRYYSFTYDKLYNQKPFLKDITESASFQFNSSDISRPSTQTGKLKDNLSNVYNGDVITITDTVESLDVNMESHDLEPAAAESKVDMEPNTDISEVSMPG